MYWSQMSNILKIYSQSRRRSFVRMISRVFFLEFVRQCTVHGDFSQPRQSMTLSPVHVNYKDHMMCHKTSSTNCMIPRNVYNIKTSCFHPTAALSPSVKNPNSSHWKCFEVSYHVWGYYIQHTYNVSQVMPYSNATGVPCRRRPAQQNAKM